MYREAPLRHGGGVSFLCERLHLAGWGLIHSACPYGDLDFHALDFPETWGWISKNKTIDFKASRGVGVWEGDRAKTRA